MKAFYLILGIILFSGCSKTKSKSPEEVTQKVLESFYTRDNEMLKTYTTETGYQGLMQIQNFFIEDTETEMDFKVLQQTQEGDTAWVKCTINYLEKPETFKLVKEDGQWKVTEKGLREKSPF
ncbi:MULTISPECIES: DUF4878 domain-containing protein [unclassified Leeuwenhoekiella]|uniref:DUF4878 domain-containing protein n=1 Tax=unclassified Leeuwenhoekiella TaxID=2615029 RepID=UPI000C5AAA13|nr:MULTISPECIES: DUF4878 domain-containing protein [unclassified Leeuwenhoekiella]MAW94332.1 hypothetical protein [Leeuwenhoekiella sp.]MBA83013.1 hypothetical protein [Leeuwenhoekiella sp.]|tara:strand:- start:3276 stop:3641 length:366 start_codon:yes stop_codon:yes gene_type:complete